MAHAADPVIADARAVAAAAPDRHATARVRARRMIEAAFGEDEVLPAAADYVYSARTLRSEGHVSESLLYAYAALVERGLNEAEARWRERYGTEPSGPAVRELRDDGGVYRLTAACRGIDGALYQSGQRSRTDVVVVIRSGDQHTVLGGWRSADAAQSFICDRLASAEGSLDWPACATESDLVREEQALAFVLRAPWELDGAAAVLRDLSWSVPARGEIFAAALVTSWRGHPVTAATVAAETLDRYAWAPAWAHRGHLERYVQRLAVTEVSPARALDAIAALTRQPEVQGVRRLAAPTSACPALLAPRPPPEPGTPLPRL